MSATVKWRPESDAGAVLSVDSPNALRKIFQAWEGEGMETGEFYFDQENLGFLKALHVAGIEVNAIHSLIEALGKHELIIVSWDY